MSEYPLSQTPTGSWPIDDRMAENIVYSTALSARPAQTCPFPAELHSRLVQALHNQGIDSLYTHQADAWRNSRAGLNQVIVAGTAGGKSLAYNLPVIHDLLENPNETALYLFPTKALTQDQLSHLNALLDQINPSVPDLQRIQTGVYDGDTPAHHRRGIRENARVIFSNPDMMHAGILPRHVQWTRFFAGLKYIVLDEIHSYRGVFGSHVANVLRRLNRICEFYGSHPAYILTSATIENPREHGQALICNPVELVDRDGSTRSARTFWIYNPPVVNQELGIRKSAVFEAIRLLNPLLQRDIQTIVFGRARKTVELTLNYFNQLSPELSKQVSAYRGGYLPRDRREIERKLRSRELKGVISTNALELGIDIGSMDASLLIGYPGTLASTLQQIGRAGRGLREALSVLIATSDPIDQYLAQHPDYFAGLSPERVLIDPDHLVILLNHLQCAAYELPFKPPYRYGSLPPELIAQFLQILSDQGYLQDQAGNLFWISTDYPATAISLRNTSADHVILKERSGDNFTILGTVDKLSSYWMVHPNAIYMHDGRTFFVENLDFEKNTAEMVEVQEDYFTEPQKSTEIQVLKVLDEACRSNYNTGYGDLNVQSQVKGYKRIKYFTHEQLGFGPLEMPVVSFPTVGCWISLHEESVNKLRDQGLWLNDPNDYGKYWPQIRDEVRKRDQFRCRNCGLLESGQSHHVHHMVPFKMFRSVEEANQLPNLVTLCPTCHRIAEVNLHVQSGLTGIAFSLRHLAPLFIMCDLSDLEVHSEPQAAGHDGLPTLTIYDDIAGGIGLSRVFYDRQGAILQAVRDLIEQCGCDSGCPSCIGPAGENGYGGKREALAILDLLLEQDTHG